MNRAQLAVNTIKAMRAVGYKVCTSNKDQVWIRRKEVNLSCTSIIGVLHEFGHVIADVDSRALDTQEARQRGLMIPVVSEEIVAWGIAIRLAKHYNVLQPRDLVFAKACLRTYRIWLTSKLTSLRCKLIARNLKNLSESAIILLNSISERSIL